MLSKLWVAQDLFAELQAVSVLLVLVTSLQKKRQSRLYIRHLRPTDLPSAAALILSQPCKVHKKDVFCKCAECLEVQSERDCSTERDG